MKAFIAAAQISYWLAAVNTSVVPDDDDVPPEVTQKVAEKIGNIAAENVLLMKTGVQTKPSALWADRQGGNDRDTVVTIPVMDYRCPSARCPRLAHGRNQQEARLIYEDDVRAQPLGVFFTRGQSSFFHLLTRSSSRSIARRSGFW